MRPPQKEHRRFFILQRSSQAPTSGADALYSGPPGLVDARVEKVLFSKIGVPYFGVLIVRILLFRVLY